MIRGNHRSISNAEDLDVNQAAITANTTASLESRVSGGTVFVAVIRLSSCEKGKGIETPG
jgi:hypothetical protein